MEQGQLAIQGIFVYGLLDCCGQTLTDKHLLDFSLGWRWLIPVAEGDTIRLRGFSHEEEEFWHESMPGMKWMTGECGASTLLVNGDHYTKHTPLSDSEIHTAQTICVITKRNLARRWRRLLRPAFPNCREYGLLPKANSRVVLPLTLPHQTRIALNLHRPGRWLARRGMRLAHLLAGLGNYTLLRSRILLIASRELHFAPQGALQAGWAAHGADQSMDYALYLGTPDPNRKTTILPLGLSEPSVILKSATTRQACLSLENEATALMELADSIVTAQVPRIIAKVATNRTLTLHLEYRARRPARQRDFDAEVIKFLSNLSLLNTRRMYLADVLSRLPKDILELRPDAATPACRKIHDRLQSLAESGAEISAHRCHGDFASWNCAWTEQGLFVFDWESSLPQAPALSDAFYYVIAPAILVGCKGRVKETLSTALQFARQVTVASGITSPDVRVYLALWLLPRAHLTPLYGKLLLELERCWQ